MATCFACGESLASNKLLLSHIALHHGQCESFRCVDETCCRTFSGITGLRAHRISLHPDSSYSKKTTLLKHAGVLDNRKKLEQLLEKVNISQDNVRSEELIAQSDISCSRILSGDVSEQVSVPGCREESKSLAAKCSHENFHAKNDSDVRKNCSGQLLGNNASVVIAGPSRISENPLPNRENATCDVHDSEEPESCEALPNFSLSSSVSPNEITEHASMFVAKLYSIPEISRKTVDKIIGETPKLINNIIQSIEQKVKEHTKESPGTANNSIKLIEEIQQFSNPFANLRSEWQVIKHFKDQGTLILPEPFVIGERAEFKEVDEIPKIKHVKVTAQFIPMRRVLKRFFELPGVLRATLDYLNLLQSNSEVICNFVQGSFWKNKIESFGEKIVLPLFLYFDDYENNNPLGSHKGIGKCGAVYLTIPCLPPTFQSKLENIFLFTLFNSLDRATFGNKSVFAKVIDELNFLQESRIEIECPDGQFKIFFEIGSIIGDNLGVHAILGFVEGFRANYFCRFCLTHRNQINEIIREEQTQLRDIMNYQEALEVRDMSQTGVKNNCIFHEIRNFHVTENIAVDVMHDLLEGVCPYDLSKIMRNFVIERKLLSLEELNHRVESFYYGPGEGNNKPAEISETHLKDSSRLAMSSAEMMNFVRNICTILHCLVPDEDDHWELLKLLKVMVEIVASSSVVAGTHEYLRIVIAEYLEIYNKLFPQSMKPKHHFLVHYPRIMERVGVLWKISSLRYESKHRVGKVIAKSAISRRNVCRTIAFREQFLCNYRFLCLKTADSRQIISKPRQLVDKTNFPDFDRLREKFVSAERLYRVSEVKYLGHRIMRNSVVHIPAEDEPDFFFINDIVVDNNNTFVLKAKNVLDCIFDDHSQSYKVADLENFYWKYLSVEDLESCNVTQGNKLSDDCFYITKRWI